MPTYRLHDTTGDNIGLLEHRSQNVEPGDVELLDRRLHVRRSFVRGEMGEPKSRAGRRTIGFGPGTADVLEERWTTSLYRSPESLVFCHPALGTRLDESKVSGYMRKALTHDAAGNPAVYVQALAGHAQATMTERYVHAAQVAFSGAAERAEERLFAGIHNAADAAEGEA